MPKWNGLWDKYGCEICENYDILIMYVNISDTKSAFQGWIDQETLECPAVAKEEGGQEFLDSHPDVISAGGPVYMIQPDKSWARATNYGAEGDITSEGIEEHVCGTHITNELNKDKISINISFQKVTKNGFSADVIKDGVYSISFYSANGQLKEALSETFLSVGSHNISWERGNIANGVYFVELRNGRNVTRQKVIVE